MPWMCAYRLQIIEMVLIHHQISILMMSPSESCVSSWQLEWVRLVEISWGPLRELALFIHCHCYNINSFSLWNCCALYCYVRWSNGWVNVICFCNVSIDWSSLLSMSKSFLLSMLKSFFIIHVEELLYYPCWRASLLSMLKSFFIIHVEELLYYPCWRASLLSMLKSFFIIHVEELLNYPCWRASLLSMLKSFLIIHVEELLNYPCWRAS